MEEQQTFEKIKKFYLVHPKDSTRTRCRAHTTIISPREGGGVALHPLLWILSVAGTHAVGVVAETVVVSTAPSVWERQTTLVLLAVEELADILTAEPRVEEECAELGNSQTLNTRNKAASPKSNRWIYLAMEFYCSWDWILCENFLSFTEKISDLCKLWGMGELIQIVVGGLYGFINHARASLH